MRAHHATQCAPWATVILDRAPFADILTIIETAHKVAPRRYLDRFLPDARADLTGQPPPSHHPTDHPSNRT